MVAWRRPKIPKFSYKFANSKVAKHDFFSIKNDTKWITSKEDTKNYFIQHFSDLFESSYSHLLEDLEGLGQQLILEEENVDLMRIPLEKEIKNSIWRLYPSKSPRPDGYLGIFYRSY